MAATTLLLLGLLACANAGVLEKFRPRIVNGEDAAPGEIPYQVSLQLKASSFHFCGGSVLNDNYVITAAHCVSGKQPDQLKVIAGTVDLEHPYSTHFVQQVIVHEEYNPGNSWLNDIALLKVAAPFRSSRVISHVPIPTPEEDAKANDVAVVSGWGRIREGGPTTNQLQRVNIYISDQTYCRNMYRPGGYTIHDSHVCAYDPDTMKGSCHGDSGGPLTVNGKLVGLVSWAMGCARTDYPTVYTRVVSHLKWIEEHAV